MTYSFESLSHFDFEGLVRDLLNCALSCRFEGFGVGSDSGIDGRYVESGKVTILQVKHYKHTRFSGLSSAMRQERAVIDRLAPDRYILATSASLTPANKDKLADIIGPSLTSTSDIFGFDDLNDLLREHDKVAKAHVKLWLTNTTVFEHVLHVASHNFTMITREDIQQKFKVYVQNCSFSTGRSILESEHILIISGAPGVGKTTLAEMLCYAYIGNDWEFVTMRSLEDGFVNISNSCKQIIFYDDFLGETDFDKRTLSIRDSDFVRFLSRVARTPTARLIMTTRTHIYKQARRVSRSLSDQLFDTSRCILDVGDYTRRIRAQILYNHLVAANVPIGHIRNLVESDATKKIVDHEHYNPRIVESMTRAGRIKSVPEERYANEFVKALDDPTKIWNDAFRDEIPQRCRHLLYALYFASKYKEDVNRLRKFFECIHPQLCVAYGQSRENNDFEASLKALEGGFVAIVGKNVSFLNPSIRDYIKSLHFDKEMLNIMANCAVTFNCAKRVFDQFQCISQLDSAELEAFLEKFVGLCERVNRNPYKDPHSGLPETFAVLDMRREGRIELLLEWWRMHPLSIFLATATKIAGELRYIFDLWQNTDILLDVLASLLNGPDDERDQTKALADAIEKAFHDTFEQDLVPDYLDGLINSIDARGSILGDLFHEDIKNAVHELVENINSNVHDIESDAELADYVPIVEKLAKRVGCNISSVETAKEAIQRRIEEIESEDVIDSEPWEVDEHRYTADRFTDQDLDMLFAPLLADVNGNSDDT